MYLQNYFTDEEILRKIEDDFINPELPEYRISVSLELREFMVGDGFALYRRNSSRDFMWSENLDPCKCFLGHTSCKGKGKPF